MTDIFTVVTAGHTRMNNGRKKQIDVKFCLVCSLENYHLKYRVAEWRGKNNILGLKKYTVSLMAVETYELASTGSR